ncbi:hypothetical protein Taro_018589 [Colocasia esculenta]|uniref:Guanylate-binding protein/Atlastin C-terminal domain-containing protein n=1 Tax=Colocasia esculenta TaxID=4460 RepID=A0A843URT3_COLES|nr:hypothetical protein [Colocasia esculenta]
MNSLSLHPHLQRTKLCDMKDSDLDPTYVRKRDQLKELVTSILQPKIVQSRPLNGKEFISFLEQILDALNKGEIPSTGSLVEVFNKEILERCLKLYSEMMDRVRLPLEEKQLEGAHDEARNEAIKAFNKQHFGRNHAGQSLVKLDDDIQKVLKNFILANEYQSSKLCEALYTRCEDKMDQLQALRLPSMAKFNAGLVQCNQSFQVECVGPSKINYEQRIMKMLGKSRSLFIKEYNNRLFNWLVTFSLVMVVVGRFIIKFILLEIGAWIMFIFLETYTRMFWTSESLYYNPAWHFIVATWETIVYNPMGNSRRSGANCIASVLEMSWEKETWFTLDVTFVQYSQEWFKSTTIRLNNSTDVICSLKHLSKLVPVHMGWPSFFLSSEHQSDGSMCPGSEACNKGEWWT